ncbi:hypothetical protein U9M48_008489 [Paspalum notatum var. saurae]|uniref:Uncharacterized protein n=1 Tax=Paspalum notatum var. saurae TaxID=547442 RepID=A0AAQ3SP27_PASNO
MPPKKKPNVSVPTKQHRGLTSDATVSKKNIRCIPQDVLETIAIMNQWQRQAVARKGFSDILDMTLDAIGSRSHLCWLMDKLDPKDMTICPGLGKELKITKEAFRLILDVPCAGGGKPLGVDASAAADRLRSSLGLTKDEFTVAKLQDRLRLGEDDDLSIRCLFLILFNRLLFPSARWNISNTEVLLMEEMDRFPKIDWCHLTFSGICDGAQAWHQRTTTNISTTIYGCCIVVLIYYLDHLHVATGPEKKFDTPRIKYFDRNIIKVLIRADKRKSWQGGEPFGHCDFRSATDTCYASARKNHGLRTSSGRAATRHEDTPGCHGPSAPAPESHAPQPPPSNTKDCHADADDRRHYDFARIKDMLSRKIQQLPALERPKFETKLAAHDQAVEQQIATIKYCLTSIVNKQFDLKDTFYEMIDDVLRAEATNNDETPQPSNDHDHAAQEPCTDSGTQLSPDTQLDMPVTDT